MKERHAGWLFSKIQVWESLLLQWLSILTNGNEDAHIKIHSLFISEYSWISEVYSASCENFTHLMRQLEMFECFDNIVTDKNNSDCVRNADIFWTLGSDLYALCSLHSLLVLLVPSTTSEISANVSICYAILEKMSEPTQRRRADVKRATFTSLSNCRFYSHW